VTSDVPPPAEMTSATASTDRPPLLRGLPLLVWGLCALMLMTMLVWSFTRATFSAQDERAHVGAVLYAEEFREWPGFQEMPLMLSAMRAAEIVGTSPFSADEPWPRPDRPSWAELTTPDNLVSGSTVNQMSQHPPLYYAGLAAVHRVLADAGLNFDLEVWIWRALSAIMLAPLPLLAAALARRLGAGRRMIVLAAAAMALLPALQLLGGSVNNDNLLIASSAWVFLGMGCVLTGDLRVRTALWIGLAAAVALLTKAFALPIAAAAFAAYVVAAVRTRRVRQAAVSASVLVAAGSLGGWWWVRNLLLYGTLQPSGHGDELASGPLSFAEAWPVFFDTFVDRFFPRYWIGANGGIIGDLGVAVSVALTALFVVVLVAMLIRCRATWRDIVDDAVLAGPVILMALIVAYQSYRFTVETGIAAGAQGRYLFPAAIGAAAVFAVAAHRAFGDLGRRILLGGTLAIGLGGTVWRLALARGSWEPDATSLWAKLDAVFAWSPLPYAASVGVYVLFAVALLAVVALSVRELARAGDDAVESAAAVAR